MYPAVPSQSDTITTARISINTFSWLEIKKSGQSSVQILNRLIRALHKVNPTLPDDIDWAEISVKLAAPKPVSD
jgi:hypothetical protein